MIKEIYVPRRDVEEYIGSQSWSYIIPWYKKTVRITSPNSEIQNTYVDFNTDCFVMVINNPMFQDTEPMYWRDFTEKYTKNAT